MTDLYAVLEVSADATDEEIKRAYRRLARRWHPDANPDDPEAEARFKQIAAAYEVLSDPERRARYDRYGTDDPRAAGADPFGAGLGDIFEAFFGGGSPFGSPGSRARSGPPRGEDLETEIVLGLEEVVVGVETEIEVRTAVRCEECDGSGAAAGTSPVACSECGGSGQVRRVRQSLLGQMVTASVCGSCGGRGEVVVSVCPSCRGQGRTIETRTYSVEVPAGVDDGATLRLPGRGAAGPHGGAHGDLYVNVRVRPHEVFRREGDDLHTRVPVAFTQAALGARLQIETFDGERELVVPPGTASGTVFTFRGLGVPHLRRHGRGDLLVEVVVEVPDDLDEEQVALLRRLAALRGETVADPSDGLLSRLRSAFR